MDWIAAKTVSIVMITRDVTSNRSHNNYLINKHYFSQPIQMPFGGFPEIKLYYLSTDIDVQCVNILCNLFKHILLEQTE